jgi:hypothetical protein
MLIMHEKQCKHLMIHLRSIIRGDFCELGRQCSRLFWPATGWTIGFRFPACSCIFPYASTSRPSVCSVTPPPQPLLWAQCVSGDRAWSWPFTLLKWRSLHEWSFTSTSPTCLQDGVFKSRQYFYMPIKVNVYVVRNGSGVLLQCLSILFICKRI